MIVFLKQALALTMSEILDNARIITSSFDEKTANKAQSQLEIRINYIRSLWSKPQRIRTYDFEINVIEKNLRTEDNIQNTIDRLCYGLLGANRFGNHLEIVEDSFKEFEDGLWSYQITIRLSYTAEQLDCMELGFDAKTFDSLFVSLYPTFESDFDKPPIVEPVILLNP